MTNYQQPLHGFLILIGLISPIFIFVLLRYISGIPLLEKSAKARFGKDKKYQKYIKNTPRLLPNFWK